MEAPREFEIREARTDAERERAHALLHETGSRGDLPGTVAEAAAWGRRPGYALRYWLADDLGAAVLLRQAWRPPGFVSLQVGVVVPHRRRGVGDALFRRALAAARASDARRLLTEIDGGDAVALGFATRRGFAVTQQFRTMVLDVAAFPFERFAPAIEARAARAGARVFSFAETGDTDESRRRLYALNKTLAVDIPGNDDTFPDFDAYVGEVVEADWFCPEGQFIASVDADGDERWVGLVGIGYDPEARRASHEFTAVARPYRGMGIAQALKLRSIRYAAERGARELVTGNDAINAAMLAVNRKLGYREQLGAARLERDLEPTPASGYDEAEAGGSGA